MSTQMVVNFTPMVVEHKVSAQARRILFRLVIGLIYLIGITIFYLRNPYALAQSLKWLLIFSVGVTVLLALFEVFWLRRLRGEREGVGLGMAMILSGRGIETERGRASWDEITELAAVPGAWGHGYRLRIARTNGDPLVLPLDCLDVLPGTLDSAIRAYSMGRRGLDLSRLDD